MTRVFSKTVMADSGVHIEAFGEVTVTRTITFPNMVQLRIERYHGPAPDPHKMLSAYLSVDQTRALIATLTEAVDAEMKL